jgi:hypothetical protein
LRTDWRFWSTLAEVVLGLEVTRLLVVCFIHVYKFDILLAELMTYSIEFALLVHRAKPLRVDVLPFVLLYLGLGYLLYTHYDDDDLNLYFRLALIGVAFLNCTIHPTQPSPTSSVTGLKKCNPSSSTAV